MRSARLPGFRLNNTGSATLPALQNVTLTGMVEGIDVRWEAQSYTRYWIAYQAVERSGIADSWAYMRSSHTIHLIRHLAGGYEYQVYVQGCSDTGCSDWVDGGTVWTETPRSGVQTVVIPPTSALDPTPTPTVTPTPSPSPTPIIVVVTATPTPAPTPVSGLLSCAVRRSGTIDTPRKWNSTGGVEVVSQVNKDIEVVFTNPEIDGWKYGIKTAENAVVAGGGDHDWHGLMFIVTSDGDFQIIEYPDSSYPYNGNQSNEIVLFSESLETLHVPIDLSRRAQNLLTFMAQTDEHTYRFLINRTEVDFTLPDKWVGPPWRGGDPWNYTPISPYRRGWLIASQPTDYAALCTRNAN